MIEGIEIFYQRIAEAMVIAIPEEWSSARFDAYFFGGSSIYEAEYVREVDGKVGDFQPADDGDRAFRQLRKKFKEAGKPLWGQATLELRPDGKFDIKFSYANCDANGNLRFDEEDELKRLRDRINRLSAE